MTDLTHHYTFERSVWRMQRHFHERFLVPLLTAKIERGWADGSLPLPPLGWCRRDVWYVGDLS